jgi:hypothetical protein
MRLGAANSDMFGEAFRDVSFDNQQAGGWHRVS